MLSGSVLVPFYLGDDEHNPAMQRKEECNGHNVNQGRIVILIPGWLASFTYTELIIRTSLRHRRQGNHASKPEPRLILSRS